MAPEATSPIIVFSAREDVRRAVAGRGPAAGRAAPSAPRVLVADLSGSDAARNASAARRALRPGDALVALVPPGEGSGTLHADAVAEDLEALAAQAGEASRALALEREIEDRQRLQETLLPALRDPRLSAALGRFVGEQTRLHRTLRRELAARHEELLAVLESMPDAVLVLDGAGRLIRSNRVFRAAASDAARDPASRRISDFFLPPSGQSPGPWEQFRRTGRLLDFEADLRGRAGGAVPVSINASSLPVEKGGSVWVLRDLTASKLQEAQTLQAEKMAAVGRLAAGVAHDFNNLLTVIIGGAQLGLGGGGAGAAVDAFREILAAARQAAELTRQLLAFGRRAPATRGRICLQETVESVSWALRRLMPEDVRVEVRTASGPWWVAGDAGQVRQIVLNLALNARDAMPAGGTILIELEGLPEAVRLSVSDTGEGMPAEVLARVFDPFFTTKGPGRGCGLGLSVVHGLVKSHGGEIRARSSPGRGTRFEVDFPRGDEAPAAPCAGEELLPARPAAPGARVLLVEDEDGVRRLAQRVLERAGYAVVPTPKAEEALRRLEAGERYDLLVTDVVMPGMSGPELRVECLRRVPGLRILFISGYPDGELGRHGLKRGDVPFLGKPFAPAELLESVGRLIDTTGRDAPGPRPGARAR